MYSDVLDLLEGEINLERARLAKAWQENNQNAPARSNPFGGEVSVTGGSGSIEGEGKNMALAQNLGRSCTFLTEGKRFLKWMLNESSMNESIVVELYERAKWKRLTINAEKTFTFPYPFMCASGSLHPAGVAVCLFVLDSV